ncbi:MAG: acyl-CoA thioesterase II [Saprospiraceae bacterium]|nr:MAG: acyl-CoA thioesterase II [Saprospiraceae bacterium]
MKTVDELLTLLQLEQIEENIFRGISSSIGSPRVFGGQVLAQSLSAAIQTVPVDRFVHSLQAYFLLPGDISIPIIFTVDCIRDGGSFTTRSVKAIQRGKAIFHLSASFQLEQEGFDHQVEMPKVQPPEELPNWEGLAKEYNDQIPDNFRRFLELDRPLEFKLVERYNFFSQERRPPYRSVWMRARGPMPDDKKAHQLVLAYASDYNLLTTALLPHGQYANFGKLQLASLDHAMWFHRDFRFDEWLLYVLESPSASNARGFTRGNVFSRDGKLVASVAQEGLIRPGRG